ncbi:MAG: HigA family addiction module antitoxin [Hyphomicrobium sp.]|jgi:addiction module HigA family antidote
MPRIRTHPGEILREEYLEPLGLSARALANAIGVPPNRISELVAERRGITADTAMRLARHFRTTPEFWMSMQSGFDLSKAKAETDYSAVPVRAA